MIGYHFHYPSSLMWVLQQRSSWVWNVHVIWQLPMQWCHFNFLGWGVYHQIYYSAFQFLNQNYSTHLPVPKMPTLQKLILLFSGWDSGLQNLIMPTYTLWFLSQVMWSRINIGSVRLMWMYIVAIMSVCSFVYKLLACLHIPVKFSVVWDQTS